MKKICILIPTVFNVGGEQRVVTKLTNLLLKNGYEVDLLLFTKSFKEDYNLFDLDSKAKVIYISKYNKFIHKLFRKIRNLNSKYGFMKSSMLLQKIAIKNSFPIKEVEAKVKAANYNYIIGVGGDFSLLVSLLKDINSKKIGWQHSNHEAYFKTKSNRHVNELKAFKLLINKIDKYIVLTKTDQTKFYDEFKIKVEQVYNPKSFESKEKSNLSAKQIVSAGRMVPLKNFPKMIDVFYPISLKYPDWKLKLIGDGEDKKELLEKIKEYNLQDKVILSGFSNNIVKDLLNSSIYMMMSKWEGFPMIMTECLEIGLPMISFDIDVMKEFLVNEEEVILVKKFDFLKYQESLEMLVSSIELRENMAKKSKNKNLQLSDDKIFAKWSKILKDLEQ